MRRWHSEQSMMMRRWRMELATHVGSHVGPEKSLGYMSLIPATDACKVDCHCAKGPGTMRKSRPGAGGCSNPACGICHPSKGIPKARSMARRREIEYELAAG